MTIHILEFRLKSGKSLTRIEIFQRYIKVVLTVRVTLEIKSIKKGTIAKVKDVQNRVGLKATISYLLQRAFTDRV